MYEKLYKKSKVLRFKYALIDVCDLLVLNKKKSFLKY